MPQKQKRKPHNSNVGLISPPSLPGASLNEGHIMEVERGVSALLAHKKILCDQFRMYHFFNTQFSEDFFIFEETMRDLFAACSDGILYVLAILEPVTNTLFVRYQCVQQYVDVKKGYLFAQLQELTKASKLIAYPLMSELELAEKISKATTRASGRTQKDMNMRYLEAYAKTCTLNGEQRAKKLIPQHLQSMVTVFTLQIKDIIPGKVQSPSSFFYSSPPSCPDLDPDPNTSSTAVTVGSTPFSIIEASINASVSSALPNLDTQNVSAIDGIAYARGCRDKNGNEHFFMSGEKTCTALFNAQSLWAVTPCFFDTFWRGSFDTSKVHRPRSSFSILDDDLTRRKEGTISKVLPALHLLLYNIWITCVGRNVKDSFSSAHLSKLLFDLEYSSENDFSKLVKPAVWKLYNQYYKKSNVLIGQSVPQFMIAQLPITSESASSAYQLDAVMPVANSGSFDDPNMYMMDDTMCEMQLQEGNTSESDDTMGEMQPQEGNYSGYVHVQQISLVQVENTARKLAIVVGNHGSKGSFRFVRIDANHIIIVFPNAGFGVNSEVNLKLGVPIIFSIFKNEAQQQTIKCGCDVFQVLLQNKVQASTNSHLSLRAEEFTTSIFLSEADKLYHCPHCNFFLQYINPLLHDSGTGTVERIDGNTWIDDVLLSELNRYFEIERTVKVVQLSTRNNITIFSICYTEFDNVWKSILIKDSVKAISNNGRDVWEHNLKYASPTGTAIGTVKSREKDILTSSNVWRAYVDNLSAKPFRRVESILPSKSQSSLLITFQDHEMYPPNHYNAFCEDDANLGHPYLLAVKNRTQLLISGKYEKPKQCIVSSSPLVPDPPTCLRDCFHNAENAFKLTTSDAICQCLVRCNCPDENGFWDMTPVNTGRQITVFTLIGPVLRPVFEFKCCHSLCVKRFEGSDRNNYMLMVTKYVAFGHELFYEMIRSPIFSNTNDNVEAFVMKQNSRYTKSFGPIKHIDPQYFRRGFFLFIELTKTSLSPASKLSWCCGGENGCMHVGTDGKPQNKKQSVKVQFCAVERVNAGTRKMQPPQNTNGRFSRTFIGNDNVGDTQIVATKAEVAKKMQAFRTCLLQCRFYAHGTVEKLPSTNFGNINDDIFFLDTDTITQADHKESTPNLDHETKRQLASRLKRQQDYESWEKSFAEFMQFTEGETSPAYYKELSPFLRRFRDRHILKLSKQEIDLLANMCVMIGSYGSAHALFPAAQVEKTLNYAVFLMRKSPVQDPGHGGTGTTNFSCIGTTITATPTPTYTTAEPAFEVFSSRSSVEAASYSTTSTIFSTEEHLFRAGVSNWSFDIYNLLTMYDPSCCHTALLEYPFVASLLFFLATRAKNVLLSLSQPNVTMGTESDAEKPNDIQVQPEVDSYDPIIYGCAYYTNSTGGAYRSLPAVKVCSHKKNKCSCDEDVNKDLVNEWEPKCTLPGCVKQQWKKTAASNNKMMLMIFVCMISGRVLGWHYVNGSEGRKDVYAVLYKYFKVAPIKLFYDFACGAQEYCLNRFPDFFKDTHFYHDIFHGVTHGLTCSSMYKWNTLSNREVFNTSVMEQTNTYINRVQQSVAQMGWAHTVQYTEFFFMCLNLARRFIYSQKIKFVLEDMCMMDPTQEEITPSGDSTGDMVVDSIAISISDSEIDESESDE